MSSFFRKLLATNKIILTLLLISISTNDSLLQSKTTMISSKNPISIDIKRIQANQTGIIRLPKGEVRSKPLFFQQTLGIREGQPFIFDIAKWQDLQRCGLFRNLTAKATTNENGEVILKICGEELSSITFSPEIEATTSIERPEVSGGVSFIVAIPIKAMAMIIAPISIIIVVIVIVMIIFFILL